MIKIGASKITNRIYFEALPAHRRPSWTKSVYHLFTIWFFTHL